MIGGRFESYLQVLGDARHLVPVVGGCEALSALDRGRGQGQQQHEGGGGREGGRQQGGHGLQEKWSYFFLFL